MYKILTIADTPNGPKAIEDSQSTLSRRGCEFKTLRRYVNEPKTNDVYTEGFREILRPRHSKKWWVMYSILLRIRFFLIISFSNKAKNYFRYYVDWETDGHTLSVAKTEYWYRVLRDLRRWQPDLIHCQFAWNVPYAAPLAEILDIPMVCTVHGSDIYKDDLWSVHLAAPSVAAIACVSRAMQNYISESQPDLRSKTTVVYNAVDPEYLVEPTPPGDKLGVVVVAAFRKLKNHVWLIRALGVLAQRNVEFKCDIIGQEVDWEAGVLAEIKAAIDNLGLTQQIRFHGWQSANVVRSHIDNGTVLVLPSTSEGLPTVLLESQARMRVPVATELPGTREALADGVNGKLVPLNDDEGLADALLEAHRETVEWKERTQRGRDFVISNFSPTAHANTLLELYDMVTRVE